MLFSGAELPALWATVFLAAMVETALRFQSWAKLEEELDSPERRQLYARYLAGAKVYSVICIAARLLAAVALVALIVHGAPEERLRLHLAMGASATLLIVAEVVARLIGRKWSAGVLRGSLPVLYWLSWPLKFLHRQPAPTESEPEEAPEPEVVDAAKEEIRVAIADGTTEGAIEAQEKLMIEGILKFGDVDVAQIMTPRTDIEYLEADTPLDEAIRAVQSFHHSRIPVCEETLDNVVGMAYVKDLLVAVGRPERDKLALRHVMRRPFLVPETNTVDSLLQQFRDQRVQIAVVIDEYGGTAGLVTVEDVLEEIVGEIEDEYDVEETENRVRVRSSGALEVDARVRIDELNEQFDLGIPADEDYDTIGGFVTDRFARVPQEGEEHRENGLLVRILQSDERRVQRVFVRRIVPEKPQA